MLGLGRGEVVAFLDLLGFRDRARLVIDDHLVEMPGLGGVHRKLELAIFELVFAGDWRAACLGGGEPALQ